MAKNTNVTAQINKYTYGKDMFPKLSDPVRGWNQDKSDYYSHIGGYPIGEKIKGRSYNNLSPTDFQCQAAKTLSIRGWRVPKICCNVKNPTNKYQDWIFNNKNRGWELYDPDDDMKKLERTAGCSEEGYYRVTRPDKEGVRYIIFVQGHSVTDYVQAGMDIIEKNYLFGGEFYILDKSVKGNYKKYYLNVTCQPISANKKTAKNSLLLKKDLVPIYEVEYYKK